MTEEEVIKQQKRIEKFNNLNSLFLPYKTMAKYLNSDSIANGIHIGISQTYGGDTYISCSKGGQTLASVSIDYNEELAIQLIEIVKPIIFNKVKEFEEKIEKI